MTWCRFGAPTGSVYGAGQSDPRSWVGRSQGQFLLQGPQTEPFENDGKGISYNPWTPCNRDRDLLIEQRLNVLGASSTEADGAGSFRRFDRIRVRLSERVCDPHEPLRALRTPFCVTRYFGYVFAQGISRCAAASSL
jgi:hypothetical protein